MPRSRMKDDGADLKDPGQPEGRYANYFEVGHNAVEFVFDFGQFYSEGERARVHTRIVTSPSYAKAFLETLRESIARYEESFGPLTGD